MVILFAITDELGWHYPLSTLTHGKLTEHPRLGEALRIQQHVWPVDFFGDWSGESWAVVRRDLTTQARVELHQVNPQDDSAHTVAEQTGSYRDLRITAARWRRDRYLFLIQDPYGQTARFVGRPKDLLPIFPKLEAKGPACETPYRVCGFEATEAGAVFVAGLRCDRVPSLLTWNEGRGAPHELLFDSLTNAARCVDESSLVASPGELAVRWSVSGAERVALVSGDTWHLQDSQAASPFADLPRADFKLVAGRVVKRTKTSWRELSIRTADGPLRAKVDKLFLPPGEPPVVLADYRLYRAPMAELDSTSP